MHATSRGSERSHKFKASRRIFGCLWPHLPLWFIIKYVLAYCLILFCSSLRLRSPWVLCKGRSSLVLWIQHGLYRYCLQDGVVLVVGSFALQICRRHTTPVVHKTTTGGSICRVLEMKSLLLSWGGLSWRLQMLHFGLDRTKGLLVIFNLADESLWEGPTDI